MFTRSMVWLTAILLTASAPAFAQRYNPIPPYELNLHGGAFFPDDDDADVLVGARFMLQKASGWGYGGNFDWVPLDEIDVSFGDDEDVDVNLYLYSFEVDYTFPSTSPVRFFVGAGVGAASLKLSDVPDQVDDLETDFLLPLAAGLKFYNRQDNPSWAFRVDVRDNIIWAEDLDGETDPQNNFEVSGGISFLFGE